MEWQMTEQKHIGKSSGKIKTLANFPQMMWFKKKTENWQQEYKTQGNPKRTDPVNRYTQRTDRPDGKQQIT